MFGLLLLVVDRVITMPLLKRKPFSLAKPPEDLESSELVYQVRFTKEIYRDYLYPSFLVLVNFLLLEFLYSTWLLRKPAERR